MRIRTENSVSIGVVVALQLAVSLLAIVLLSRMGPVLGRIASVESDAVVSAVESLRSDAVALDAPRREAAVSAAIEAAGEARASAQTAVRLGRRGGWSAALLGAAALFLGVLAHRRARLRIELPVGEILGVIQRVREGNPQARVPPLAGPAELETAAVELNAMLDQIQATSQAVPPPEVAREADIRRVLGLLLDAQPRPTLVVNELGQRVASNQAAIGIATPALDGQSDPDGWVVTGVPGTTLRLVQRVEPA